MSASAPTEDGPWHPAPQFRLAVLAGVGDLGAAATAARLAAACVAGGLPLGEARAVPPGGLHGFLHRAVAAGVDVLVTDPRVELDPGAVAALRRVAGADPMIAGVVPRFATGAGQRMPAPYPAVDYGLLPDPRCTYAKASALAMLDERELAGEDHDLVGPMLALNRFGFRMAVAGEAWAFHPDATVPPPPSTVPPSWRPALLRHRASAPAVADAVLEGLRPGPDGRRAVAFDLTHVGSGHSGTTGLARALVHRAAARWTDLSLHVVANPDAYAAHFGDLDGRGVTRCDPAEPRSFAALIRFGQPFLWREMEAAVRRAPVLVLFLLDTIGLDCQHDAPDELDALWRFCIGEADAVLFNSAFTARQFERRFGPPPRVVRVSLHSLALADYGPVRAPEAPPDGRVLVVGNAMPHKRLVETASRLAAAGLGGITTVLGLAADSVPGVTAIPSGSLSPDAMAGHYAEARVVVYPSAYEGFGFPVLEALAHRRPVLVRDLPPYAEIAAGSAERANIHVFADDADLLRRLSPPPAWVEDRVALPARTWDDGADDLRAVLDTALAGAHKAAVVRRIDALRGRMSFMRARAFGDADDADELDRLAWLSARVVQLTVLWLGRHVPGTRTLLAAAHRGLDRLRGRGALP